MSKNKDLTRIEDLSEYLHDLTLEDPAEVDAFSGETPDLDSDEVSSFEEAPEALESNYGETASFGETPSFDENNTFEKTSSFSLDKNSLTEDEELEDESDEEEAFEPESFESPDYEPLLTKTDLPRREETMVNETFNYTPAKEFTTPENFEDVKKFAESTSFTGSSVEGNPSFSVLIKNVRYIEDVNDILNLLKELSLMSDTEEQIKNRLVRGHLLVPRISEYAAIFLAHKLRRFDIDIQVGLSDEVHPPKHLEKPEIGLNSKYNLFQNQNHHFQFDDPKLELSQIIVAATPSLEGYQVVRYLGVASEHKLLDGHIVEDESSNEIPLHYKELAQKLKAHALKAHSNAVVGLNYQITPLPSEMGLLTSKYRLTCTGNLVWVNKL